MNSSLYKGDAIKILDNIQDEQVHAIITDPPYFIDGFENDWDIDNLHKKTAKSGVVGSLPVGMKFDIAQSKHFGDFISIIAPKLFRILKPGGFLLMFSQPRLYHRMTCALEDTGFEIRDMICWKKNGQAKAFSLDHFVKKLKISDQEKQIIISKLDGRKTPQLRPLFEPLVLAQKPKQGTFLNNWLNYEVGLIDITQSLDGKFPGNVVEVAKPSGVERSKHFTQKPILLIEHLVKIFTCENQIVIDPFMGTGSHGIATINTNRQFIGIELNEQYFNEAFDRIKIAEESRIC